MASVDDQICRHEGCDLPRGRYSVFCDRHHQEEMDRVGLARPSPSNPCEGLLRECRRTINARKAGAITADEMTVTLFDLFVHAGNQELQQCWRECLVALPTDVVTALLAYAKAHPEPRLFHPLPAPGPVRAAAERRALALQAELITRLERLMG